MEAQWPWPDNEIFTVGCRVKAEPTHIYNVDAKDYLDAARQVSEGVVGSKPVLVLIKGGKL